MSEKLCFIRAVGQFPQDDDEPGRSYYRILIEFCGPTCDVALSDIWDQRLFRLVRVDPPTPSADKR